MTNIRAIAAKSYDLKIQDPRVLNIAKGLAGTIYLCIRFYSHTGISKISKK